ncbi:MAG: hypothetical protein C0501_09700 [Isosphaera sp.]|nr:hypothetical protein [Isosphaera sp.]
MPEPGPRRFLPRPPRRPANSKAGGKGAKDCIILEHALDLSARLGAGYPKPRYFVSSNTGDFAEKPANQVHQDLRDDFTAAHLEYVPSLIDVVALLRAGGHL